MHRVHRLATEQATPDAFALTLIPYHEGTHFAASFGHLMSGYDAGRTGCTEPFTGTVSDAPPAPAG